MKSVIHLDDVWKVYNMGEVKVTALKQIDIDIKEGEFVAIMGASGSGKSTALNAIGCLDTPSKGRILLDGNDISKLEESSLARIRGKKIGFVFQTFNLVASLTALENVTLPMIFQNIDEEKRNIKGIELLKKVGLSERINHFPNQLSGGERQRVAIARALANDPEVILADEPTGNLDSKTGKEIMELLKKLNIEGKTIIIVTHDAILAKYAHRVVHLRDGEVVGDGKGRW